MKKHSSKKSSRSSRGSQKKLSLNKPISNSASIAILGSAIAIFLMIVTMLAWTRSTYNAPNTVAAPQYVQSK